MFSLRKRFKLIEENSFKQASCTQFENLPIEIYYLIFDNLKGNDLIKFRLINSFFKRLVDETKYLWLTKLTVHVRIRRKLDLDHFLAFVANLNNDTLVIDCLKEFKYQNMSGGLNEKMLKIEFKFLNMLSFNCLNLFSNNCTQLRISSFLNTFGQIKSESQSSSDVALKLFSHLNRLEIICVQYEAKENKYFIWNDIYLEEFFQIKFKMLFANIRELKLKYYSGSNKTLIKCLKNLVNLTSLELVESTLTLDDYASRESRKKLNIQNLNLISVNLTLSLLILKRLTNLDKLEDFKLKLSNNDNNNLIKELNDLLSNLNCNIHVIL